MKTNEIIVPFDVVLPASTIIRAGDLTMLYEEGNLRNIKHGHIEIIRMIYPAIRNQHWQTAPYELQDEKVELSEKGFMISYKAMYKFQELHYKAFCTIEGKQDNTIIFSFEGEALSPFLRNRIGLCVLHPVRECIGRKVIITGADGSLRHFEFPELISPHQPFVDIRELQWETEYGIKGTLVFEGDIFETEDQRNWTDSSFKTYSTALHLPYPVQVVTGQKTGQRVTLKVSLGASGIPGKKGSITEEKLSFPNIGYIWPQMEETTAEQINRLKKIPFHHCRIEVRFDKKDWQKEFSTACSQIRQTGVPIELIVFFEKANDAELKELITEIEKPGIRVFSILVLQNNHRCTPPVLMKSAYDSIKESFPSARVGYGTDEHFAELNRNRPMDIPFDFVNFTIYPQVHNSDIRTIIENLENQADTLASAKIFIQGRPIHISPLLFNKSFNADPRLQSRFAALWTLIAIQNVSETELITLDGSFIPDSGATPLYDLLLMISEFKPQWIIRRYEDNELLVNGLMLENADGERIFFTGLPK
ncbi:MAG: hypothetical protein ABI760_03465 [Ferruginibacter sp.]